MRSNHVSQHNTTPLGFPNPWVFATSVSPEIGTTLKDEFKIKTCNWTDDATSLPLVYGFVYFLFRPSQRLTHTLCVTHH